MISNVTKRVVLITAPLFKSCGITLLEHKRIHRQIILNDVKIAISIADVILPCLALHDNSTSRWFFWCVSDVSRIIITFLRGVIVIPWITKNRSGYWYPRWLLWLRSYETFLLRQIQIMLSCCIITG